MAPLTGLEYFGDIKLMVAPGLQRGSLLLNTGRQCNIMVLRMSPHQPGPEMIGWTKVAQVNQRTRNSESVAIYRRRGSGAH